MGIRIMRKGKTYRRWWYGEYRENGKIHRLKLDVRVSGKPPSSFSVKDEGDTLFEASKAKAQKCFEDFMVSRQQKGNAESLMESLIESKTGKKVSYIRLDTLADRWNGMARIRELSEERQRNNIFVIDGFAKSCGKEYLYQVTSEDVKRYFDEIRKTLAWSSVKSRMSFLSGAFNRFLPHGCVNPFKSILKRNTSEDAAIIHRVPLTEEQVAKLKEYAHHDTLLYPLVICGLCTGARLKDICLMKKSSIDLREGFVTFVAAKTTTHCLIPLFDDFRTLCEDILATSDPNEEYLFPEAATMYIHNHSGIVRRGKLLFARALFSEAIVENDPTLIEDGEPLPPKTHEEVLTLIDEQRYHPWKTSNMKTVYRLYAIDGKPYHAIAHETGIPKGTICGYMKEIEWLTNEHIIRFEKGKSQTRKLLAKTRIVRKSTKRSVSAFGWASLRSTFCRIAIENGVDPKVIMLAVGHKNYATTMTYYNNPTMVARAFFPHDEGRCEEGSIDLALPSPDRRAQGIGTSIACELMGVMGIHATINIHYPLEQGTPTYTLLRSSSTQGRLGVCS